MQSEGFESIYESELHPLVERIHAVCRRMGMPAFVCIQDGVQSFRTTVVNSELSEFEKLNWMMSAANAWSTDELLGSIIENAVKNGHNSMVLLAMGIPTSPS